MEQLRDNEFLKIYPERFGSFDVVIFELRNDTAFADCPMDVSFLEDVSKELVWDIIEDTIKSLRRMLYAGSQ